MIIYIKINCPKSFESALLAKSNPYIKKNRNAQIHESELPRTSLEVHLPLTHVHTSDSIHFPIKIMKIQIINMMISSPSTYNGAVLQHLIAKCYFLWWQTNTQKFKIKLGSQGQRQAKQWLQTETERSA
jgi:hypothetical protein